MAIDVGIADLNPIKPALDLGRVKRLYAAGEPVLDLVLPGDRRVEVGSAHEPEHRSEALVQVEPRTGPDPGADTRRPDVTSLVDAQRLHEPVLARFQHGQAPQQFFAGGLDQRAHHGGRVEGIADPQAPHRIGEPRLERGIVVHGRFDDGQARGRAFLAGMTERRSDEVLDREVDVGGLGDDHRVLAARLTEQPDAGLPFAEHLGRLVAAGKHDEVDIRMRDEVPAGGIVRRARQLDEPIGHSGRLQVGDERSRDRSSLRCRLEDCG